MLCIFACTLPAYIALVYTLLLSIFRTSVINDTFKTAATLGKKFRLNQEWAASITWYSLLRISTIFAASSARRCYRWSPSSLITLFISLIFEAFCATCSVFLPMTNKSTSPFHDFAAEITLNTESLSSDSLCSAMTKIFMQVSIAVFPRYLLIFLVILSRYLP